MLAFLPKGESTERSLSELMHIHPNDPSHLLRPFPPALT